MRVSVELHGRRSATYTVEIEDHSRVADLLQSLSIYPDAVICFIGDEPVPFDSPLSEGSHVTIVEAASGGHV